MQRTFDSPLEGVQCNREKTKLTFLAPQLELITGDDAAIRELSKERGQLIFKEKFRWYIKKEEEFKVNFFKAFALRWET